MSDDDLPPNWCDLDGAGSYDDAIAELRRRHLAGEPVAEHGLFVPRARLMGGGRNVLSRPLAIDLYCGLGGWTEGLLIEGYDVVGFDIERHRYGTHCYPAQLVLQDILTLRGSQFRDATLIVASPPCQAYSYRAMPWKKAKTLPPPDNTLFDACFRIQREACEAAGRHVPMVVENVRGAQKWVGRARWNYGSFYLWGDVPALMPFIAPRSTLKAAFSHQPGGITIWQAYRERMARREGGDGLKCGGDWFNSEQPSIMRLTSSKIPARKAASAMIAKIPLPLSRHIAACFLPKPFIEAFMSCKP